MPFNHDQTNFPDKSQPNPPLASGQRTIQFAVLDRYRWSLPFKMRDLDETITRRWVDGGSIEFTDTISWDIVCILINTLISDHDHY